MAGISGMAGIGTTLGATTAPWIILLLLEAGISGNNGHIAGIGTTLGTTTAPWILLLLEAGISGNNSAGRRGVVGRSPIRICTTTAGETTGDNIKGL